MVKRSVTTSWSTKEIEAAGASSGSLKNKKGLVGRQAFEDAQFERNQDAKMRMIARVSVETYKY